MKPDGVKRRILKSLAKNNNIILMRIYWRRKNNEIRKPLKF